MLQTSLEKKQALIKTLAHAREGHGLSEEEFVGLWDVSDEDWTKIFKTAAILTGQHFNNTLRFFAPLYFSNYCVNDCLYCGFRRTNISLDRRMLTPEEFIREARHLWDAGHRTIILISGEHPIYSNPERIAEYLFLLHREKMNFFIVLEVGPLDADEYNFLKTQGVRQALIFQETYDEVSYAKYHTGLKQDFLWRLHAPQRAIESGLNKVGLGILLGLSDVRQDLVGLFRHAHELKKIYDVWPSTFSFPRLRPAPGLAFEPDPKFRVSDADFEKVLALVRLAFPQSGIILSTRENASFRDSLLRKKFGVTHLSAGSCTAPGGYVVSPSKSCHQFEVSDERSLNQLSKKVAQIGYQPIYGGTRK